MKAKADALKAQAQAKADELKAKVQAKSDELQAKATKAGVPPPTDKVTGGGGPKYQDFKDTHNAEPQGKVLCCLPDKTRFKWLVHRQAYNHVVRLP
jgi:hypothetical protein